MQAHSSSFPYLISFVVGKTPYTLMCDKVCERYPARTFSVEGVSVTAPVDWSDTAIEIAYTRWAYKAEPHHETSIYQMCFRQAYTLASRGSELGYFSQKEAHEFCAKVFEDFLSQTWFLNSPQWFNTGIYDLYGVEGDDCGLWRVKPGDTEATPTGSRYEFPQVSACFIQRLDDTLTEGRGILPLVTDEARLFKGGSGTGTNFTSIRHEGAPMSNGGYSSGLMSFLKIGDVSAAAIKSGGTTRRAAKMVLLDADHPDIEKFIQWKLREEDKVAQMTWASRLLQDKTPDQLLAEGLPKPLVDRIREGHVPNLLSMDFNGEAVMTVSGQSSNNTVRFDGSKFFHAVDNDLMWPLLHPGTKEVVAEISAKKLWRDLCFAAWACGDPGLQFDDLINAMNPVINEARIRASNPCAEYLFIDDTSCNLASVNLIKFLMKSGSVDLNRLITTTKRITVALDISIAIAAFPSKALAEGTWRYRPIGIGFSNLGGLLMAQGIPYDSDAARSQASLITKCMMRAAQLASVELAGKLGPFPAFLENGNAETTQDVFGKQSGLNTLPMSFRNAQLMVIAPCGTIGIGMDCDTLGIEPGLALVRYKKLADSKRILKMTSPLVKQALESLGYNDVSIRLFCEELEEHNDYWRAAKAAGVKDSDAPVFQTALGNPTISWQAHLKMLAAVQPHISGGISKTVNIPGTATVEDVGEVFRMAYDLGVKCVTVFREGCKDAPYTVAKTTVEELAESSVVAVEAPHETPVATPVALARSVKRQVPVYGSAQRLKTTVAGHTIHVSISQYDDGTPAEVFVEMGDTGTVSNALMDTIARLASKALQYGVPVGELLEIFQGAAFEPAGLAVGLRRLTPEGGAVFVGSPLGVVAHALERTGRSEAPGDLPVPVAVTAPTRKVDLTARCQRCGSHDLVPSGSCKVCRTCGESAGGCS